MRFLKDLGHIFMKLLSPVENILSYFKVIHQISLIILIMVGFLVLQGILALNTINKMQSVSQGVFNSSIQGFQATSMIRQELGVIRNQYTLSLFEKRPLFVSFVDIDSAIASLTNCAQIESESEAELATKIEQLTRQLNELKNLVKLPVDPTAYKKIDLNLTMTTLAVRTIEDALTGNATVTMQEGNLFFNSSRNTNILLVTISSLLSLAIGLSMAAMISKPLQEMVKVVGLMATGDFTSTIKVKGSREVKKLVDGLNHAIMSLRNLVFKINEHAQTLNLASKELNNSSHESGRSASEVARAMETMARAAHDQSNQMAQTADNVNILGNLVRKVSQDSMEIAKSSMLVSNSAKHGHQITTDVANTIDDIYITTKELDRVMETVNRTSEEVGIIVAIMESVAEQTTLLALNASIEAARAGEQGKGFSVVANETRKLAEQSKQASAQIGELIAEMAQRSNNAVQVIQKGVQKVEAGKTLSIKATVTFENIFHQLEDTLGQIDNVALSAQQMAEHNEQVVEAVTAVAAISEEGLATTQEISATVEQQSASAEEVAAFADNLANIAEMMQQSILAFKI